VHLLGGNLGFPDDPSAQRRRGIAPKNIVTYNTLTQALVPRIAEARVSLIVGK
jgi:hypothetical protein